MSTDRGCVVLAGDSGGRALQLWNRELQGSRHASPRLAQRRQLTAEVATRFAHAGTAFIPGTVRYTVAGYNPAGPIRTEWTLRDRWDSAVAGVEAITGITMTAIRPFPATE